MRSTTTFQTTPTLCPPLIWSEVDADVVVVLAVRVVLPLPRFSELVNLKVRQAAPSPHPPLVVVLEEGLVEVAEELAWHRVTGSHQRLRKMAAGPLLLFQLNAWVAIQACRRRQLHVDGHEDDLAAVVVVLAVRKEIA